MDEKQKEAIVFCEQLLIEREMEFHALEKPKQNIPTYRYIVLCGLFLAIGCARDSGWLPGIVTGMSLTSIGFFRGIDVWWRNRKNKKKYLELSLEIVKIKKLNVELRLLELSQEKIQSIIRELDFRKFGFN